MPERQPFKLSDWGGGVLGGSVGLLLVCLGLLLNLFWPNQVSDSALWFVGLLALMATVLTLAAIVFGGLKLSDANEAFGLPSGSVRTLLAVGVMVLFAVFGLKFFADTKDLASQPRLSDTPLQKIPVAPDKIDAEVARYEATSTLKAIKASPGRPASGTTPAVDGEIHLYRLESRLSPGAEDARKQLLTAIITLLTTVVGFYFGSKSAGDGMRGRADGSTSTDPGAAQRQHAGLTTDRDALDARIKSDREILEGLRTELGNSHGEKLEEVNGQSSRLDKLREQLARALSEAQTRLGAIAAAPPGGEAAARDAAQKAVTRAAAELDVFKQAAEKFEATVLQLRELVAKAKRST